jgi:hypothetical protein
MFPFDQHTDTMISYLRSRAYSGARAGSASVEQASITDPFYLNFKGFPPEQNLSDLDSFASEAVSKQAWAIREVHGVNDGSWGVISLQEYEAHLNYLKSMVEADKIWVATLSDVLFYRLQKEKYMLMVSEKDELNRPKQLEFISDTGNTGRRDPQLVNNAFMTSKNHTLSVVVHQKKSSLYKLTQHGKDISFRRKKGILLFDVDPQEGAVRLFYKK